MNQVSDFKLGILVSGRGTNLQAIIDSIEKKDLNAKIVLVISNIRDAAALERCRKHGIESRFLDPAQSPDKKQYDLTLAELLRDKGVDLICLAGYMRILGKSFIGEYQGKIVNIHPSLLPAFPGLDAQRKAVEAGVKFSGCTVHFVNEQVDAGPIILQSAVPVYDSDDTEKLSQRILEQERLIYPKAIKLVMENKLVIKGNRVSLKDV